MAAAKISAMDEDPSLVDGGGPGLPTMSIYDIVQARVGARRVANRVRANIKNQSNLAFLRDKSRSSKGLYDKYIPKVSETFLEEWLDFPHEENVPVMYNSFMLVFRWLSWTNKGIASLHPSNTTIRERLCASVNVLGMAAGLFLVLAAAGFLVPPSKYYFLTKVPSIKCTRFSRRT